MSIHVQLERFEGPLGLLLHLIREQEMDIFNINIHEITRQYLEYIKTMRRLDLEVAGEFVAMAATLLHIKSRTLLPQYNEEGEEVVQEDPRKELVQRLLEYKRFQELSVELYRLPLLGRDVFARGERESVEPETEGDLILDENPLFSLISAYRTAVRNMKQTVHRVTGAMQSIAARILEIREQLVVGRRVVFRELIQSQDNIASQVLVTFLSVLELAKMGFISVFQTEPFADIYIETKSTIDGDVVSRVENYDSVNADLKAQEILNEAQLSLDEPVAQLEGEEAPVVEAGFVEAASDADIEAEEQRLFAEESRSESMQESPASTVVEAEDPIAPIAEFSEAAASEMPPIEAAPSSSFVYSGLADLAFLTQPEVTQPEVAVAPAQAPEPGPPVEAQAVTAQPSVPSGEEKVDIAKQNLNSALRSALSAFDAFAEPAPPRSPESEVES